MDPLRILAESRGCFTRADALTHGHDDNSIRRLLKAKLWRRIRAGAYTFPDLWGLLSDEERHLVTARTVGRRLGPAVALSHTSAALEHSLRTWRLDLSLVHTTRLDGGAGRTEAGVQHHEGFCTTDEVIRKDGYLVVDVARAALEAATLTTSEGGLVIFDSYLALGHPRDDLDARFGLVHHWPDTRKLQIGVRLANGGSGSVGESRSRYLCYAFGLPMPVLQFEVRDPSGELIGITDFAWPERRLVGEFDGRIKYGRLLRPGEEPGDAVFREKVREDAIREATGWSMIRLTWADLERPAATAARLRRALGLQAA